MQKMTLTELLNDPLVKGDKRIREEALNLALNQEAKRYKLEIQSVTFAVNYRTNFGQEVAMVGSTSLLGGWDANSKGVVLTWNEGHLWKANI